MYKGSGMAQMQSSLVEGCGEIANKTKFGFDNIILLPTSLIYDSLSYL